MDIGIILLPHGVIVGVDGLLVISIVEIALEQERCRHVTAGSEKSYLAGHEDLGCGLIFSVSHITTPIIPIINPLTKSP